MPSREQRVRVWRGELKKTTGGLTKDDLVKNKKGKIVSRRKSRQAGDQNNLGEWLRNKGDRFQDTPQARAEKGLPHTQSTEPRPAPEPKPERVPPPLKPRAKKPRKPRYEDDDDWVPDEPVPKPKPKVLKAKKPRKPRYEDDEDWDMPEARLPKPKPVPKPRKLKLPKAMPPKEIKPKALMPKPPRPMPKPRKRKLRRKVSEDVDLLWSPPKAKPKPKPRPFRHKVERDENLAKGLRIPKKKRVVLHAREPQPEFVKFKDMGKSSLRKAAEPAQLYPVRKDIKVESAPIATKRFGAKHTELSVSNIRRRRRKKRVDYSKYFEDPDEWG